MNKQTILINLFGGPGIVKSTTATGVFSLLKMHNVDCEYIPEFAKDLVWEERYKSLKNQYYIFSKQYHRMWRLNGIVDLMITDSPLLLSLVYFNDNDNQHFKNMVQEVFHSFININFLLKRVIKYNPNGRYQDEDGAKFVDQQVLDMLKRYGIVYEEILGDHTAVNEITNKILTRLYLEQIYEITKKE